VDRAFRRSRSTAQTLEIFKRPAMDACTGGDQRLRGRFRACEPDYLMARTDQFFDDGRTDESGCPGNENSHRPISQTQERKLTPVPRPGDRAAVVEAKSRVSAWHRRCYRPSRYPECL